MSALDTIAAIGVGVYVIAVAVNGNTSALIDQAVKDKGFLKWAIAVAFLVYLYKIPGMAEPVTLIITIAFLGLFIKNGTKISSSAEKLWSSLSGS